MGHLFLHADDNAAVDWDCTVVILGLYVEGTSESVDGIVPVKGSSVEDIITVTVEGTSVDGIVAVDALLCMDVVVEAIILVEVVDCFDVVDDVAVNVVSADDDDNVEVVVVIVTDGGGWDVEGRLGSPLQLRVRTTSTVIRLMIQ